MKLPCSNCGELLKGHCAAHLIPCCPGKCSIDIQRIREATGLGLRETRQRLAVLIDEGYPAHAAVDALIAQGPAA